MPARVKPLIYRFRDVGNVAHTIEQLLSEPEKLISENQIIEGQSNIRIAALLLYMFEFDGFVNYALVEATKDPKADKQKLSLKNRIKAIYAASMNKNDVLGETIFQEIDALFTLRDGLVHPKIVEEEYIDETVRGPVSNEKLSEYMTGELSEFCEPEKFEYHKNILKEATNKILRECNISLSATSSVLVRSG